MDETFADVWADYLLGSGWSNRDELTHRAANFVVVQYKSRPNASTVGSQSTSLAAPTRFQMSSRKDESLPKDERVDAAWFVIQEVVPAQYRADLEAAGRGKGKGLAMIRKLTMFRSRKEKSNGAQDKAQDVSAGEEDVFRAGSGGTTKRILLSDQLKRNGSKNASQSTLRSNRTSVERDRGEEHAGEEIGHAVFRSEGHQAGSKLMSTLRAKSMRVVKSARRGASSPALKSAAVVPDEGATQPSSNGSSAFKVHQQGDVDIVDRTFTSADFETRSVITDASSIGGDDASYTSANAKRKPSQLAARGGAKKPASGKDDAWIDIMLKANGRMAGQDAPPPVGAKCLVGSSGGRDGAAVCRRWRRYTPRAEFRRWWAEVVYTPPAVSAETWPRCTRPKIPACRAAGVGRLSSRKRFPTYPVAPCATPTLQQW